MTFEPHTVLVVDAANVVGSVPDGWWHDRAGATERLRDALAPLAGEGVPGVAGPPLDVMLVVEGAARKIAGTSEVTVVPTTRSGDDAIVDVVAAEVGTRRCVVVTADRDLRTRVRALGAEVVGPRTIYAASHLTRD